MKTTRLLNVLDEQVYRNQTWLFTTSMLRLLFPDESENSLSVSLHRQVQSGVIRKVHKGLYANERVFFSRHNRLAALVPYLKPARLNYLSQETRLSQLGLISQIPVSHLTVMTTANSQVFRTAYGTVEFTHTKQPFRLLLEHTCLDTDLRMRVADEYLALRDLKHARRNLDMLVDELEDRT